jgi:Flp pilus assembly protein TadD
MLGLQTSYAATGDTVAAMEITRRMVEFFPRYLARVPDDARAHLLFAGYLAELGQREQALLEADTGLALGGNDAVMLYNFCCVYCLLGETEKAIELLAQAFAAGYGNSQWARVDPDLDVIRGDPRVVALLEGR